MISRETAHVVVSVNVIGWRNTCCVPTVHSYSLPYVMLFCETQDLICEIISASEKKMKNCIVNILVNV